MNISRHGFASLLFTTVEARSRNITMIIVNVRAIMVKSCLEMFFPCLSNEMAIANVNIGPLWNRLFLAFPEAQTSIHDTLYIHNLFCFNLRTVKNFIV
jgi:hypothetical protein